MHFVELGEFSENVEIFAQIETTVWQEFLQASEDLNLRTIAALENLGVKLAVPPR